MRRKPAGYALALTLSILSILVIVIIGMARSGDAALNAARNELRSERALYGAESGIADALVKLKASPTATSGSGSLPVITRGAPVESYKYTIYRTGQSVPNGATIPTDCVYILSTGTYQGLSRQVGVTLKITSGSSPVQAAYYANSLSISGGSWVDSYNSANGLYSAQKPGTKGDISTNAKVKGSIQLSGGSYVKGGIHVGVGGVVGPAAPTKPTSNSNNTVWKDWNCYSLTEDELAQPIALPAVEIPSLGASQGDLKVNYKGASPSPGTYAEVTVNGGGTLTLTAGSYVFDSLKITGGGKLSTSGAVKIYIKKELDLSGGGVVNTTNKPANLVVLLSDSVEGKISGGAQSTMVVYGPKASLKFTGGNDLYGALIGNDVTVTGGSKLHYDEALSTFSLDGSSGSSASRTILSWQRF